MLILISPAKTLDYSSELPAVTATQPTQVQDAQVLIEQLRQYSLQDIARLMHLSDKLASLNTARYESWQPQHTPDNARPAVFAFKGDVYQGLDVTSLKAEHWPYLQQHLRILSGLYGVLRPLDYLQPYRLEMGTKIKTAAGNTLYDFWGERITQRLNADLAQEAQPVTLNLASTEYFSAVKPKLLQGRLITPVFKDWKNGQYKIISFYAKKARGLMVRYCTQQHIDNPEAILDFNLEGYYYSATHSKPDQPVFLRDHEAD